MLVANAGGNLGLATGDLSQLAASWRADFDGNVLPTVLLTEALLDAFARPGGRIVAMSSVAALRGSSSYGAAKAAVNAWVLWMAGRLAQDGVTVNAVAPGFVPDTDFWRSRIKADPGIVANRVAPIPMGRPGTPEEVAEAVAYLAAPDAGWTTGQILQVNGGHGARARLTRRSTSVRRSVRRRALGVRGTQSLPGSRRKQDLLPAEAPHAVRRPRWVGARAPAGSSAPPAAPAHHEDRVRRRPGPARAPRAPVG